MNCSSCDHFDRFEPGSSEGVCVAHPAQVSVIMVPASGGGFRPENFSAFPTMRSTQRCGEWEAAKPKLFIPN